jgi:hypothetical protein
LDIGANTQYFDSDITFTPADNPLNTLADVTATCRLSNRAVGVGSNGYYATISSASSNTITAGSVLSFDSFVTKYIIRCQISGTLGGDGVYFLNVNGNTGGGFAGCKIRPTGMTLSSGTYTQTANQTSFYNTAVFDTGTPTAGMTMSPLNSSGYLPSVPFFVINQNSGTTWNVTMGNTTGVSGVAYYATSSQQVLIPQPSSSNSGRIIKITNISYNPINITTSTGTNVFGGKYAQISNSSLATPSGVPLDGFSHLLRAGDTVILKSNGAIWDTQEGTSISGSKTYTNNTTTLSAVTERTKTRIILYPLDQTFSNLTGLTLVTNPSLTYIGNTYKYSITVVITATVVWATQTVANNSTQPLRLLYIDQSTMDTNGFSLSAVNTSPISCSLSAGLFAPTASVTTQQTVCGTFTLKTGDAVTLENAKINGSATVGENIISVTLSAVRVG